MKIISFDIGIKNLSYCLFDVSNNYTILDWDIINLCDSNIKHCNQILKNKQTFCNNKALYKLKGDKYLCKLHTKNRSELFAPNYYYKLLKMKRYSIKSMNILSNQINYNIIEKNKENIKNELISYINNNLIIKIEENNNSKTINLIDIGIKINKILINKFNLMNIDKVLIENQISTIANRMSNIQYMLTQCFIDNNITNIEFISSSNKLKLFDIKKYNYSNRKKSSIEITNKLLKNNKWIEVFKNNKKKDDLADSFLQGLWYIYKNNNIAIE
jgi:hypothetical protein